MDVGKVDLHFAYFETSHTRHKAALSKVDAELCSSSSKLISST